ncbi:makorin%2C ring finger protein, 4 [Xyrichtys novacula]|uniref:RING-type E3 ubiquitin transferase n=1 Tax=Xyrichtys novacula TaxID=13765 RepID=A0AAV1HJT5_XYRNO|nr:makorin%2C ring finger protein, 4 [Xyrichtys novacula]
MERAWRYAQNTRRMDSVRNGGICRRFINGYCRFGSRCYYQHEWPAHPSAQICRYFQKGGCWYGEQCRYLHVLQPETEGRRGSVPTVPSISVVNAPPYRRGSEPALLQAEVMSRQESGRSESVYNFLSLQHNTGGLATYIAEERTQDPDPNHAASVESAQSSEVGEASAQNKQEAPSSETTSGDDDGYGGAAAAVVDPSASLSARDSEAYNRSRNVTCGICMEVVYEKTDPKTHMFGILPNCNHAYCLHCIMTWRKTKDLGPDTVKTCPQCRVRSAFYVPHKYWVEGQEKDSVIAAFKRKFSKKSCTYYSRHRYCPFRAECLYRHDKDSRHGSYQYPVDDEDEDDFDRLDLLNFFLAMTLLGTDDDDLDDDDDYDFPFYLAEEFGF